MKFIYFWLILVKTRKNKAGALATAYAMEESYSLHLPLNLEYSHNALSKKIHPLINCKRKNQYTASLL